MPSKVHEISTDAFDAKLVELKELDTKIVGLKGTIAEWNKKATEATHAYPISGSVMADLAELIGNVNIQMAEERLAHAVEVVANDRKEAKAAWILGNKKDDGGLKALTDRREAVRVDAEALRNVFAQIGVELAELPKAPRTNSANGTSTTKANKKGVQFYGQKDGARRDMSPTNNSLGGIAWYVFGECGTPAVESAIRALGWDGTFTTTQEYGPVTIKGKDDKDRTSLVGWEVKATDAETEIPASTDDDEPEADEVPTDNDTDDTEGDDTEA